MLDGTLDECLREFMAKPPGSRHLYEIHTQAQPPLVQASLTGEIVPELVRLRDFFEICPHPRRTVAARPSDPQGIDNLRHVANPGIIHNGSATAMNRQTLPAVLRNGSRTATSNIQCSGAKCDRRMVVRLATPPQDLSWSKDGPPPCKECGAAGSVNIVPFWHDRIQPCRAIFQALEIVRRRF